MSRPRRPDALPLRDGVSASCAVVHGGPWASVLDFLCERLPVLPRVAVVGVIYGLLFVGLSAIVLVIAVNVAGCRLK